MFTPGATVLILAKAERQSQELFLKVLRLLTGLAARSEGALSIGTNAETAMQLRLANGARIIALPGNAATVRSYRADLLLIDEAAQVPNELLMSVLPMIAVSRGTLVLLSSCYGARGFFYDVWRGANETAAESADDDPDAEPWLRKRVSSEDCPRIPAAYLREAKATMGRWWYAGEFLAEFVDPEDAVFTQRDIDAMFAEDYEVWDLHIDGAPVPIRSKTPPRVTEPADDRQQWELPARDAGAAVTRSVVPSLLAAAPSASATILTFAQRHSGSGGY